MNETATYTVNTDTFAIRLFALRTHLGWSKTRMSTEAGLPDSSLVQWERGTNPRNMAEVVQKISSATGCDPMWLMWGTQAQNWKDLSPSGTVTPLVPRTSNDVAERSESATVLQFDRF